MIDCCSAKTNVGIIDIDIGTHLVAGEANAKGLGVSKARARVG